MSTYSMKIKPAEKIDGFISYLDKRGLTDKADRVKNLWEFVNILNKATKPLLEKLNVILFTDPGTVIVEKYFNYLPEIIDITLEIWNEVKFPIQESMLVRTASFLNIPNYNFPKTELSISMGKKELLKALREFIKINKPEQIILHPRIDNARAKKELIAIRAQSVAGDISFEVATGNIYHVRDAEKADIYQEFRLNNITLENINSKFIQYIKAFKLISAFADKNIQKYTNSTDTFNTPVYEMKCFTINNNYYMNLFDYELI